MLGYQNDTAESSVLNALRKGFCRFAGPVKIAAILGSVSGSPKIYGDKDLFEPFESEIICGFKNWPDPPQQSSIPLPPSQYGIEILDAPYVQIWRVLLGPSNVGEVITTWLNIGATRLAELASKKQFGDRVIETAPANLLGAELEHYASNAIGLVLANQRAHLTHGFSLGSMQINYIIEELARISKASEEHRRPTGVLAVIATDGPKSWRQEETIGTPIEEPYETIADFDIPIPLTNYKHAAKLLQLVKSDGCLIADQNGIRSIAMSSPVDALIADFRQGIVHLRYGGVTDPVCRIVNGEFVYEPPRKDTILDTFVIGPNSDCLNAVNEALAACAKDRHGCTIVLLEEAPDFPMMGHELTKRTTLPIEFIRSMTSVDGAIVLDFKGTVLGFGYLLDGVTKPHIERRARGARFNSALRFSEKIPSGYVIVTSEDGPMTIFQNQKEVYEDPLTVPIPFLPHTVDAGLELEVWSIVLKHHRENSDGSPSSTTSSEGTS